MRGENHMSIAKDFFRHYLFLRSILVTLAITFVVGANLGSMLAWFIVGGIVYLGLFWMKRAFFTEHENSGDIVEVAVYFYVTAALMWIGTATLQTLF
jgi:hypothetical protein